MLPPLRPYQRDAYARLRAAAQRWRAEKPGYGLLAVAPTGAGKTRLALELATRSIAKGRQVLWLAPRTELVDQPVEHLRECGWTDVRVLQADRPAGEGPITVASIQTLVARGEAPAADLVILDEARHFVAPDWGKIASAYLGAVRVGLDATPARADGAALGDLFDEIIEAASIAELTADGWLVPARIIAPAKHTTKLAASPVEAYREHTPDGRALVFCSGRKHAAETAETFTAAGIPAMAVDSHSSKVTREHAVAGIRDGSLRVLCNVNLFTEGFDAPGVDTIVIARGVAHETTWLQMLGRGLRPAGGRAVPGELCTVLDLKGHCHRHGWPEDARTWHLEGRPVRREEALPAAVQCPACHAWSRGGGPCPICGATKPPPPPPKVSKRELAERRRAAQPRTGKGWELWRRIVLDCRAKGSKPQAAALQYRRRTGHWPRWGVAQVTEGQKQT